ncbi:hypothetical protein DFQ27_009567 [Actinomortierella ambigua]|uniref:Uncharacterized protein n=1 Tax=Actinomortierella ambigua TaxID=1343610 RepID=A0A9P6PQR0_9FUNG|nr:hypothetical protein DFQ27_009567 [Actinomortierella ambigua]
MDLSGFQAAQHENVSASGPGSWKAKASDPVPKIKRGPRSAYTKASGKQLESLIEAFMNKGLSVDKAAKRANLPRSTAYRFIRRYLDNPDTGLSEMLESTPKRKKPERHLTQEHTEFILSLIASQATLTVESIHKALKEKFQGLAVSKSTIYTHIWKECRLSLKRIVKIPQSRIGSSVIDERFNWVDA